MFYEWQDGEVEDGAYAVLLMSVHMTLDWSLILDEIVS
jgi:hypothetical protein